MPDGSEPGVLLGHRVGVVQLAAQRRAQPAVDLRRASRGRARCRRSGRARTARWSSGRTAPRPRTTRRASSPGRRARARAARRRSRAPAPRAGSARRPRRAAAPELRRRPRAGSGPRRRTRAPARPGSCASVRPRRGRARAAARASARARILDAAVKLIAREGIDDVRIARIAMEAGVSPSLLHYHFASRDALLAEALEHSYELAGDDPHRPRRRARARRRRGCAAMIDQCLPAPGALRDDWMLWVELWLHAAPPARAAPDRRAALRAHARRGSARRSPTASRAASSRSPTRRGPIDRLLALIDGYGIRALIEDPAMPLERARAEIWAAVAAGARRRGLSRVIAAQRLALGAPSSAAARDRRASSPPRTATAPSRGRDRLARAERSRRADGCRACTSRRHRRRGPAAAGSRRRRG